MKFSTSFALFGISALAFSHSALVSAEEVNATIVESSESIISNVSGVPSDFDPSLPVINPSDGLLSLVGIDLSDPLTTDEATFLESTIRAVFNKIHEDMEIDLIADSVTVGREPVVLDNHNDVVIDGNLRGGSRKLHTGFGTPQPDIRPCTHMSGPLKGEGIEGCEWDIEIFLDCRCWLCFDDDFQIGVSSWKDTTPAPYVAKPTAKPTTAPTQAPTRSAYDKELLKALKESHFKRFNKLKKARFQGGWGNRWGN
jgi:hypothetical protein